MTSPNSTRAFGVSRLRVARFVSRIRARWVWYDTHRPLVPQAPWGDRSPLPGQRSERAAHMAETR